MLRLFLAWLLLGLVAVPAASAASTTQILRDCADDGVLQGTYTAAELRKARKNIPTDADEYTDCRDVLARAAGRKAAGASGGGAGGSGGAANALGRDPGGPPEVPQTPEDQKALDDAYARGHDPMEVDGRRLVPGAAGLAAAAPRSDLPGTLIAALALLGGLALAGLLSPVRRDLLARAGGAFRTHVLRRT
jgi:hypothetical protein